MANPNPSMPVPHPRSRMVVPGPASPLSRADRTTEEVKCTDVGYCSSSTFGLGNTRLGKEERHDSRCFSFMPNWNNNRGEVPGILQLGRKLRVDVITDHLIPKRRYRRRVGVVGIEQSRPPEENNECARPGTADGGGRVTFSPGGNSRQKYSTSQLVVCVCGGGTVCCHWS